MNRLYCVRNRIAFLFIVFIFGILFHENVGIVNGQSPTASEPEPRGSDGDNIQKTDTKSIQQIDDESAPITESTLSTESLPKFHDAQSEQGSTERHLPLNSETPPSDTQNVLDGEPDDMQEDIESLSDSEEDADRVGFYNDSDIDGDADELEDEYDMGEDSNDVDEDEDFYETDYETEFETVADGDDVIEDGDDFDVDFEDEFYQDDDLFESDQQLQFENLKSMSGARNNGGNSKTEEEKGHVAFFKWKDLGSDVTAISVLINGHPAEDVLLHNSTMLSFRIPSDLLHDKELLASTLVEIHLGSVLLASIPLVVLEKAISQVNLAQLRLDVEYSRSEEVSTIAPLSSQESDELDSEPAANIDSNSEIEKESSSKDMDNLLFGAERYMKIDTAFSYREAMALLQEAHEAGNSTATVTLASLYLGDPPGVLRDIGLAVSLIQNASAEGDPDGHALLGFLHASGIVSSLIPVDKGKALLLWTLAAEGGSDIAKMALAFRHFFGVDLEEDCNRAAAYYAQVAEGVVRDALNITHPPSSPQSDDLDYKLELAIREILPPRPFKISFGERTNLEESEIRRGISELHEIVEYNQHAADQGEARAQLVIGTLTYYGAIGLKQDYRRAREYFLNAAKGGRADAHAYVGYIDLMDGKYESAIEYMKKAVDLNERLGMNGMGYVTLRGIGVERDPEVAADYFKAAAELQHPAARYNLAVLYAYGVGVPQSPEIAYGLLMEASRDNHLLGSYKLGMMLLKGISPAERNCQKATMFLKRVSEQGMWNSVLYRALQSYERRLYRDALLRYLLAGHCGLDVGQFNSAFLYEHGLTDNGYWSKGWPFVDRRWSGSRDSSDESQKEMRIDLALDLYQYSASQGSIDAMVRLGDLAFAEKRDYKRAAAAYEKAVKGRNPEAMFNLGWMHLRGFGMSSDKHMAKRYFDLAIDTEQDAYIPASIALFLLRKSDAVLDLWHSIQERIQTWQDYFRGNAGDQDSQSEKLDDQQNRRVEDRKQSPLDEMHDSGTFVKLVITPDIMALTFLLGMLVLVVNARQRRLVQAENNDNPVELPNVAADDNNQ